MRTLKENENNDIFRVPGGNLAIGDGIDAVMQLCKSAMEVVVGEMLYQTDQGMPLFESAFNSYRPEQFEAAGRLRMLEVDGVVSIESFDVDRINNALTYTAVIVTNYGKGTING